MRKAQFEVPIEVIGDFVGKMTELELSNSIVDLTEDNEIEIEVLYEKSESKDVDELEEYLDQLITELEEQENEEEEEEEEEEENDN
jgi:hypothetical protein